jgi:outer membrane protein TolC
MVKMLRNILFIVPLFSLFGAGCSNFNEQAARKSHAKDFHKELTDKTTAQLAEQELFSLNNCIEIALENNLEVRSAKIQQQIAKLERKVSFAAFLPAVNLDYQYTKWDRQPKVKFGASAAAMHDQTIKEITWQFQMSIFDPSTWFLYTMHKRGEEVAQLVTKYVQQMTVLETTINYYHCLTLEQACQAVQSQLDAASELEKEIGDLYNEGLVTQWQYEQAQVVTLARKTELGRTQYALQQAKGDLLVSMGLSPLEDIQLKIEEPLEPPTEPLDELVCESLMQNPQLYISDRKIEIEKEKVKVTLAAFLPRLTVFANQTNTSDSFQLYPNSWTYGLAGTMAVFNGFANINEYKAAKERRKAAFVEREQQTLAIILETLKAYLNLENAKDESLLAQKSFKAAQRHFDEVNEKWKEGLV